MQRPLVTLPLQEIQEELDELQHLQSLPLPTDLPHLDRDDQRILADHFQNLDLQFEELTSDWG